MLSWAFVSGFPDGQQLSAVSLWPCISVSICTSALCSVSVALCISFQMYISSLQCHCGLVYQFSNVHQFSAVSLWPFISVSKCTSVFCSVTVALYISFQMDSSSLQCHCGLVYQFPNVYQLSAVSLWPCISFSRWTAALCTVTVALYISFQMYSNSLQCHCGLVYQFPNGQQLSAVSLWPCISVSKCTSALCSVTVALYSSFQMYSSSQQCHCGLVYQFPNVQQLSAVSLWACMTVSKCTAALFRVTVVLYISFQMDSSSLQCHYGLV